MPLLVVDVRMRNCKENCERKGDTTSLQWTFGCFVITFTYTVRVAEPCCPHTKDEDGVVSAGRSKHKRNSDKGLTLLGIIQLLRIDYNAFGSTVPI